MNFLESVEAVIVKFNDGIWAIIPWLLIASGVYFAVRTSGVQITKLGDMFRSLGEGPKGKGKNLDPEYGGISAFKAFTISAASRVGTGNIAGVAVAITIGGPGAVFWMWIIAIVGGATAFIEATLAQLWKTRESSGNYRGGPAYYMTRGLGFKPLAAVFSVALAFTFGFVYNAFQSNAIVDTMSTSLGLEGWAFNLIIGIILAAISSVVIFGGVQRIANFTQVIVPFMAGLYAIIGLVVIIININEVPGMIGHIIGHAFGVTEVVGATVGAAFSHGMRRGLFSNEAGQGSAPNAAATATVSHPVKQGLVQTLGVYFDTLLVCSITAFIILLGGDHKYGLDNIEGAALTQTALANEVGNWGIHIVTFIIFCLAFSSVLGNYYLAQTNLQYLTESPKILNGFRVGVLAFIIIGSVTSIPVVFALADTFAATMVVLNLIAIVPLGGVALKLLKNYNQQKRRGQDPVFHRDMLPGLKNVEAWDGSDPVTRRSEEDALK